MNKMKAIVKQQMGAGLVMVDTNIPKIRDEDVLIKVNKSAICGTDLHIYKWDKWAESTIIPPLTIGHEFTGTIVEIGKNVTKSINIGDRVSAEGHLICGTCRNCRAGKFHLCPNTLGIGVNRNGAFAQFVAVPSFNVFKLPEYINDNIASILDPIGNAVHTALSFDLIGEDILINGAGPIGCIAAAICKKVGARNVVITDVNPYRLKLAQEMGADLGVNVSDCKNSNDITEKLKTIMHKINMKEGFDVGLEMSGIESAINAMINVIIHGGKISILGISSRDVSVDWNKIVFKSLNLKGIYGREVFETWYKMSSLIKSGLNLERIITHIYDASDFDKAFTLMESGMSGKIILDWTKINGKI